MARPQEPRPMLASDDGLERLDRELKRRADVVRVFPSAILMEQHNEWQVARRQASAKALTGDQGRRAPRSRGGQGA